MFIRSAALYDAIYGFKDYGAEVARLISLVEERHPSAACLLDVACGTGAHLAHLRERFEVDGTDLDPAMIEIARSKLPGSRLVLGDMVDFDLGRRYDVVTCLFSSIGYVATGDRLRAAVANMGRHLLPGGLLIVEPWFSPETYHPGGLHATFVDEPDLKVARINISAVQGRLSIIDFHYLIGTPQGVETFTERHELGLFTRVEYQQAFAKAGLACETLEDGLAGGGERGLFVGRAPPEGT